MEILHITAHLGGGVGKVLSRLVEDSAHNRTGVHHTIACLEAPEKTQFVDHVRSHGGDLLICPSLDELTVRAREADIVQVEWWHHPAVASWLGRSALPAMRLVVWSHVSGLHPPEIPPDFVIMPHRFLFTSPCSWEHPRLTALEPEIRQRVGAVFSSGGFDDLPDPPLRLPNEPLRVGYVGTLNFAKLHPRLLDFLAAADLPEFRLSLVGDPTTGANLLNQATIRGIADRLDMRGYTTDVAAELAQFNVLAYLLNPLHYGTTENALLEAMAMGVVPVVLDNPAERYLVRHGETGLVVDSPITFAHALAYLAAYPEERLRLSTNASREVCERFSIQHTSTALLSHYQAVLKEEKQPFDFRPVFGMMPADWFRSCQGEDAWRFPDDDMPDESILSTDQSSHYLYEKTKSSVFHYRDVYPNDQRLQRWAKRLEATR
ncbi:MAG: glycosyltransferase family 4 protein [Candidatus Competibacteraceae bacterium]|nr:glycosyltransferase family 4 protein [Candidatus Competibacteraceae bacterium]